MVNKSCYLKLVRCVEPSVKSLSTGQSETDEDNSGWVS